MIDQARLDKGLYWQRAWKLVEGCTKVSPGCDNCWSEAETSMRLGHPNEKISDRAFEVLEIGHDAGSPNRFSGNVLLRTDNLDLPLRTRQPTVFAIWNDIFHEDVPFEFILAAYARMVQPRDQPHQFLILTKRAERLAEFWSMDHVKTFGYGVDISRGNIWHGVTVENQKAADQRIPHLLKVPGKRFLSIEPMLGPVDVLGENGTIQRAEDDGLLDHEWFDNSNPWRLNAVILGGESGKNARPIHPDWARSVRDQCSAAAVPFYFKQWGEWAEYEFGDHVIGINGTIAKDQAALVCADLIEYDQGSHIKKIGKKKAGRLLDGQLHDNLPWISKKAEF